MYLKRYYNLNFKQAIFKLFVLYAWIERILQTNTIWNNLIIGKIIDKPDLKIRIKFYCKKPRYVDVVLFIFMFCLCFLKLYNFLQWNVW